MRIVECVPNFSEGRRPEVLDGIVAAMGGPGPVRVIGREMDADHNRSVVTLIGEPDAVLDAAFRGIARAAALIDLGHHEGAHPRMGATDVVPFIPVQGVTMEDCADLARRLGRRVGDEFGIPVFLYAEAATRPSRRSLAAIRNEHQFEGLRDLIGVDPEREPDFGPSRIHPTAGATAVGARFFLIACNVNLRTEDPSVAREIAWRIRESGYARRGIEGMFRNVQALGFRLEARKLTQVSMNLTDYRVTGLGTVFGEIERQARARGVDIEETEIVGLVPREALVDAARSTLRLGGLTSAQIIETHVDALADDAFAAAERFAAAVAAPTPTPGGGSVAAHAGALAAALLRMVADLSLGRKALADAAPGIQAVLPAIDAGRVRLTELAVLDAASYDAYVAASRLPRTTDAEKAARSAALGRAALHAAEVPLRVLRECRHLLGPLAVLAATGNRNAVSDAGVAALLLVSAARGASYNVRTNLRGRGDDTSAAALLAEAASVLALVEEGAEHARRVVEEALG